MSLGQYIYIALVGAQYFEHYLSRNHVQTCETPALLTAELIEGNSNDWIVRNRQVSAKVIGLNFSSNCACAAFNWVVSVTKKS